MELLVALTVFSFGVAAVASTALHAVQIMRRAEALNDATRFAATLLDSIAASGAPRDGTATVDDLSATWHTVPDSRGGTVVALEIRVHAASTQPMLFDMWTGSTAEAEPP